MAKWKDRLRQSRQKSSLKASVCVVCARPVLGCPEDDRCPATLLCPVHYWAQAQVYGDSEPFGWATDDGLRELDPFTAEVEIAVKDWPRWRGVFEVAMKRRGLVHGP